MDKRYVDDRFFKLYSQGGGFKSSNQIWVDRETGVQYLWHADGKPLLYKERSGYTPEL